MIVVSDTTIMLAVIIISYIYKCYLPLICQCVNLNDLCALADDDRLKHICQWESHREHYQEADDTFYKPYASTVDKQRLVCGNYF